MLRKRVIPCLDVAGGRVVKGVRFVDLVDEGDPVELLNGWRLPGAQQSIVDRIAPRDIAVFHGSVDAAKLGVIERQMIKMVKAPAGDFRDWDVIRAWASGIVSELPG